MERWSDGAMEMMESKDGAMCDDTTQRITYVSPQERYLDVQAFGNKMQTQFILPPPPWTLLLFSLAVELHLLLPLQHR